MGRDVARRLRGSQPAKVAAEALRARTGSVRPSSWCGRHSVRATSLRERLSPDAWQVITGCRRIALGAEGRQIDTDRRRLSATDGPLQELASFAGLRGKT